MGVENRFDLRITEQPFAFDRIHLDRGVGELDLNDARRGGHARKWFAAARRQRPHEQHPDSDCRDIRLT
ncbi:MAG: hypothetical protein LC798_19290 [Chloroflexi bacterium]|nr:hypothetical protein [Chloroflexota bacterium]